ncbi:hypothetical protein F5Y02DRAFT_391544 [Annulohypoxylon stygium]|nr:hypothetical protein F5Y02DRAFT_391544 [Annulohypoxylon stygium]
MSNSPASSFRRNTPSRKGKSPSKESSYSPVCCNYRLEEGYSRASRVSRRPLSSEAGRLVGASTINSPIARPRSAPGSLSNAGEDHTSCPAILLPTPYILQHSKGMTSYPVDSYTKLPRGQGRSQTPLPKLKGGIKVAEGHLDLREEDESSGWVEAEEEDEGWSTKIDQLGPGSETSRWVLVDEPDDYFDMDKALEEPTVKSISITIDNGTVVEQPNPCLRVHPLFVARYEGDPEWGSMVEMG